MPGQRFAREHVARISRSGSITINDPEHAEFVWLVDNNGVRLALIKVGACAGLDDKPVRLAKDTIFTTLGANEDLALLVSALQWRGALPPSLNPREAAIHALKITRREDVEAFCLPRAAASRCR